ncbi:MAG: SPFH domain-containing protein [Candidatus Bathyarchaeia archaeon]
MLKGIGALIALFISLAVIILGILVTTTGILVFNVGGFTLGITMIVIGAIFIRGFHIAKEWERFPILRLGRYIGLLGPGQFYLIPFIETAPTKIDLRIITIPFRSEQTLTRDNVPVTVDAVMYCRPVDPEKCILNVQEYLMATNWAAQTTLREVIGKNELDTMLAQRDTIGAHLREIIDLKTEHWGVAVTSVEVKDVIIPPALQDAMARNAQAERERRARVTLATAEVEAAQKMVEAAKTYEQVAHGLELRWMNMLYEMGFKGMTIMLVPSKIPEVGYVAPVGLMSLPGAPATPQEKPTPPKEGTLPTASATSDESKSTEKQGEKEKHRHPHSL